jgi:pyruvate,water dikinase
VFLDRLMRGRVLPQLREDTHFYIGLPHAAERRAALELGRRLAGTGALTTPEDVFLLRLEELESLGRPWPPADDTVRRLHALVEDRRTRRAALDDVPVLPVETDEAADVPLAAEGALLSGQPGSAGVAEGPVRVIRGPADFGKLRSGEVLVAPFTNPSWTPLFALACAVVVDTGATMSHAAIVAREYGVPAVMGARVATTTLRDGQRIRVDGTRGLVFPPGV